MLQYIVKRLLLGIPTLLGASFVVAGLIRLVPGDVVMALLQEADLTADMQAMRLQLGLDRPFLEQYLHWLWNALQGDLGNSFWTEKPVLAEIVRKVPVSMELAILASATASAIAIPIGVISAVYQDKAIDYVGRMIAIVGLSVPGFWLGTMLLVFPSIWFQWVPPLGYVSFFENPLANVQQFMLPAIALGAALSASLMRMTRSTMLEVLRQDYVRTARAKGLRDRVVIYRHALKNAFIPIITIWGIQFGHLLGGTVIMETIFSLPGLGRATLDAINHRDYPQLQGNVLFLATVFVVMNLLVDVAYARLDPRIRYSK